MSLDSVTNVGIGKDFESEFPHLAITTTIYLAADHVPIKWGTEAVSCQSLINLTRDNIR